jgi:hypothetical protein
MEDPTDRKHIELLKLIRIHGSIETAEILFNFGFTNDQLKRKYASKGLLYFEIYEI